MIAALARGADVTEIFSPKRIAKVCAKYGLVPGDSLDLSNGWDFDRGDDRRKAVELIRSKKPTVVIGSPPCTPSSQLQTLNAHTQSKEWMAEFEIRRQEAINTRQFVCQYL